ncbi:hypothetical protein BCON_0378g00030 [Botryotinia convoluta]|uniref:Uncharacterized protein n=1 Tax=Botryotinia convoluta TaxID=54673 RepID=A0A4Z1HE17_9HELO|nr:hypothetical protein BCON_0378g00030 [Botryotinia convoluta]
MRNPRSHNPSKQNYLNNITQRANSAIERNDGTKTSHMPRLRRTKNSLKKEYRLLSKKEDGQLQGAGSGER